MSDKTQPNPMMLYELAIGHFMSRALALIAKLGIADVIAGTERGCSVEDLARATKTDAAALRRVLRLVASAGVFDEDAGGAFRLNAVSQALRSDVPGSMKALVSLFACETTQDSWKELEYCVRTGQPAFKKSDPHADAFAMMAADPEYAAMFDKAMATFAPQIAAAIAEAYDFSQFTSLVDVGGGNGTLLSGILNKHPALRGVLFDQPHVADRARPLLQATGLAARLEIAGGSFFEQVPSGHDAYLLKHVIHDWNDADARKILTVCRAAMPARAKLLIAEGVYPKAIVCSPEIRGATSTDVNMLVCTGGRQRSEPDFRQLLAAAGFELTRIVPTQGRVSVLEAVPR